MRPRQSAPVSQQLLQHASLAEVLSHRGDGGDGFVGCVLLRALLGVQAVLLHKLCVTLSLLCSTELAIHRLAAFCRR